MRNILLLFTTMFERTFRKYSLLVLLVSSVMVSISGEIHAQDAQSISGKVTEASTGDALPGVSVLIKGTTTGTITDMDGMYSITASSTDVLVFSFIGYLNEEVTVGNTTNIDINLVEDVIGLDAVVVTGYGVQKKSDLTGAIASVSAEELTEMPAINVNQALQGRAAGVNVTSTTGMPGASVQIQIRGISSINGTGPLVIVDGVRASINDLNPNDIESMEILKDASSAAIYGSAGGNGVILITTKKGKAGQIKSSFNYYRGWGKPWKKIDMLNSQEYVDMRNYNNAFLGRDAFSSRPDTFENYDYQDLMLETAITEQYDFSVTGGNETSTYFLSANYSHEEGIVRPSDYSRLSFRINSDHKLSDMITVGENVQFTNVKRNGYDEWQFQSEYNTPLMPILQMYPYIAPYDEDGEWNQIPTGNNPVVARDVMDQKRKNYSVGGNAYVDLNLFKGFVVRGLVNAYLNNNNRDVFNTLYNYSPTQGSQWNDVQKTNAQQWGWMGQVYANYNTTIAEDYNIGVMVGYERFGTEYADMSGERRDLISEIPEFRYFDGSSNDTLAAQIVEGTGWEESQDGVFGRLNFDYKSKYLITFNVRSDRSSKFGPDKRRGTFPSFSVGWKFSEEQFIQNLGFISFGKLRYGYGQSGANAPDRYAWNASVTASENAFRYPLDESINPAPGATLLRLPNRALQWETVVMSNFGIDLSFLRNRLSFTADYFTKENQDMIMVVPVPSVAGAYQYVSHINAGTFGGTSDPLVNIGSIRNSGFEFTVGYKKSEGDFRYDVSFNSTFLQNKVINMNNDSIYNGASGVNLSNIALTAEGFPVSQFNGYVTDGLFQEEDAALDDRGRVYIWNQPYIIKDDGDTAYAQPFANPGDLRYVDQNGDNVIDAADRVNIGSPIPKFIFGFSANLYYKSFDMNIFLDGKFGHQLFNASKYWTEGPTEGNNRSKAVLDQYRSPVTGTNGEVYEGNTNTDIPRQNAQSYSTVSDYYVESGNYVRLKNLQLGYTLPVSLTERVGIDKLRFYVGGTNVLTFTKYEGFDPEVGNGDITQQGIDRAGNYPHTRTFIVGLNLQF